MEQPFTPEEQEVFDLLMKANDLFQNLERQHPNEADDWVKGIHQLQYVMGMRTLRRDYPEFYQVFKKVKTVTGDLWVPQRTPSQDK